MLSPQDSNLDGSLPQQSHRGSTPLATCSISTDFAPGQLAQKRKYDELLTEIGIGDPFNIQVEEYKKAF